ncbi:hypothetical protein BH23PLA1_BH23PLA1_07300 [soil metagenome]
MEPWPDFVLFRIDGMPLTVLLAIFVAFWVPSASAIDPSPMTGDELGRCALLTLGAIATIGLASGLVGLWTARTVSRRGATSRLRRRYHRATRLLDLLTLLVFGLTVHEVGWGRAVEVGLGLEGSILLDKALILSPFLLMLLAQWWGLYPAEQALKLGHLGQARARGVEGYLILKARQALGLVLPVAMLFTLAQDLGRRFLSDRVEDPWVQMSLFAGMGGLVLVLAPALVRLSWPARSLPPGPLRDRLERLSSRLGFRCTDILVWDTGGAIVNAGVTGAVPWFRYVLLTDALVEHLEPRQIEAVFGHEVGHIAHRHLGYFGLFFLGSMGALALVGQGVVSLLALAGLSRIWGSDPTLEMAAQGVAFLAAVSLYFLLLFGHLSRKFERQADVFGCRAVSCGQADCPPHHDPNGSTRLSRESDTQTADLCPVGIAIFASALSSVAALNGMEPQAGSWRHGSIARRIAFLRGLEGRPEAERRFQRNVTGLRMALALGLTASMVLAMHFGALDQFH